MILTAHSGIFQYDSELKSASQVPNRIKAKQKPMNNELEETQEEEKKKHTKKLYSILIPA